jgi:hypothetical protein
VNEAAEGISAHQAQRPQRDQYESNGLHLDFHSLGRWCALPLPACSREFRTDIGQVFASGFARCQHYAEQRMPPTASATAAKVEARVFLVTDDATAPCRHER